MRAQDPDASGTQVSRVPDVRHRSNVKGWGLRGDIVAEAEAILLALAGIVVLGFLGQMLFRATRFSDVLILIGFGMVLGPGLRLFDVSDLVGLAPVIGTFALLVILFDGGLDLRAADLVQGLPRGTLLAVAGFVFTVAFVAAATAFLLNLDLMRGILLGCILGGSSSIAVMPIVRQLPVSERTRAVLGLESAVTDVFCVVGALTVAGIIAARESPDLQQIGGNVIGAFALAIIIGLAAGIFWLKFLDLGITRGASYVLTLAFVLVVHVGTTAIGGSGPVAALLIGVVLGNHSIVRKYLNLGAETFQKDLRAFQTEAAFVTRAFFFVYLGLIMDVSALTLPVIASGVVLVGAIALARGVAVWLVASRSELSRAERSVWWVMMPRGLAAAVLAAVPSLTFGISGTGTFVAYATLVILLTNLVSSLAGFVVQSEVREPAPPLRVPAGARRARDYGVMR